jgi:microcin C transport system substrate-binding protein
MSLAAYFFVIMSVLFCQQSFAEPAAGVSRYGKPQLAAGFENFPHINPQAPKGGILRLNAVGTFDSLNHLIVKGVAVTGVTSTLDMLMKRAPGEPFTLYPLIAEKVDIAPDASQMTIFIDPRARFHDGSPITAQDVKFTIELLIEKGWPRYRHYFSKIKDMQIKDATTLVINFNQGEQGYDPELPFIILLVSPQSQKSLEGKNFAETGLTPLLGSGPYRIAEVDPGRSITYERVKDYWAADLPTVRGQNNFDKIRIDYYKNTATQFQAFLAGDADCYFETDPNHWNQAYSSAQAVKSGKIQLHKVAHQRPVIVKTIIFNMRRPVFEDRRLREALTYAFDFETLNKMVFNEMLKRPTSLFANTKLAHQGRAEGKEREILLAYGDKIPASFLETAYVPPQTHGNGDQRENLSKADALLKEAGWIVVNGKRVKDQGNGVYAEPLQFEFLLKDPKLEKIALGFKNSLAKLGIELIVRLVDTTQYESRTSSRDFDMIIHSWSNTLSPGNEQSYYFGIKNADIDGSSNYIGVKDAVVESLAQQLPFCKDYETLTATVHALDRLVMNQYWLIPLAYDPCLYFAIWGDRIGFPTIDPAVGLNIIDYGWAKESTQAKKEAASTESGQSTISWRIGGVVLITLGLGGIFYAVQKIRRRRKEQGKKR